MTDAPERIYLDGDLSGDDFPNVRGVWLDTKHVNEPALVYIRADLATPTVQEAAKVLLPLAESRALPFYLVDMPMDRDGNGPATIGLDATDIAYQVWRASDLHIVSQRQLLSDAIPAWLRALIAMEEDELESWLIL